MVAALALGLAESGACAVPYPPNSDVDWHDLACGGTKAFVCPLGDGSWLRVVVRDQFNQPMVGVVVVATFTATCSMCLCLPVQGPTDSNGAVNLAIKSGLDVSGGPACCAVTTKVSCIGVVLYSAQKDWQSPDLNGDCAVNQADDSIVSGDLGSTARRSDFNCDGLVDSFDYALFAYHRSHCWPTEVQTGTWGSIKSLFR
jgi:hypothetical protein